MKQTLLSFASLANTTICGNANLVIIQESEGKQVLRITITSDDGRLTESSGVAAAIETNALHLATASISDSNVRICAIKTGSKITSITLANRTAYLLPESRL